MASCYIRNGQNLSHLLHLRKPASFSLLALLMVFPSPLGKGTYGVRQVSPHTVSGRFTTDTGSKAPGQVLTHNSPHTVMLPDVTPSGSHCHLVHSVVSVLLEEWVTQQTIVSGNLVALILGMGLFLIPELIPQNSERTQERKCRHTIYLEQT